jgi:hypothetical protein
MGFTLAPPFLKCPSPMGLLMALPTTYVKSGNFIPKEVGNVSDYGVLR